MSKEIAENIRITLIKKGKSIKWLSEQIGISQANTSVTLRDLEKGKSITVSKLEKISRALNVNLIDFKQV